MAQIEFYNLNDEVWVRKQSGESFQLTEREDKMISIVIEHLNNFYPQALKALQKEYAGSSLAPHYSRFLQVRRFCKCNFGAIDSRPDLTACGKMNLEEVSCPLRGECKLEGIVCKPKFDRKISAGEMRVIELAYQGLDYLQIADRLYISEHTARNHVRNARLRLGFGSKAELFAYCAENNLINED